MNPTTLIEPKRVSVPVINRKSWQWRPSVHVFKPMAPIAIHHINRLILQRGGGKTWFLANSIVTDWNASEWFRRLILPLRESKERPCYLTQSILL